RRSRIVAWVAGVAVSGWIIGSTFYSEYRGLYEFARLSPRGALCGILEVEEFVKNGAVQPPLLTDATRWRRFATNKFSALVRFSPDSSARLGLRTHTPQRMTT